MLIASRVRRISALSVWIASRSSGFRRDSRSSRSSIDGASAMIRRKASVVTQKPGGTRIPSITRKLPQLRAFAANDRDLRPVDLLESQYIAPHPSSLPLESRGLSHSYCDGSRLTVHGRAYRRSIGVESRRSRRRRCPRGGRTPEFFRIVDRIEEVVIDVSMAPSIEIRTGIPVTGQNLGPLASLQGTPSKE